MKKLFALLVVAGMVFVSCGNQPAEAVEAEATQEQVEEVTEVVEEQPAAEMPAEEATEAASAE